MPLEPDNAIPAVAALPFRAAVIIAVWPLMTDAAVTVNVAVVAPDPTATEAGTPSGAALLDSATVAPPFLDTVTVQVELAPGPKVEGLHVSPLTKTSATSEIVTVWALPFNIAVTLAV